MLFPVFGVNMVKKPVVIYLPGLRHQTENAVDLIRPLNISVSDPVSPVARNGYGFGLPQPVCVHRQFVHALGQLALQLAVPQQHDAIARQRQADQSEQPGKQESGQGGLAQQLDFIDLRCV